MRGDLTAASAGLGQGTTLTFVIPLCTPPPDLHGVPGGAADFPAPVLLVEAAHTWLPGGADDTAAMPGGEAAGSSGHARIATASSSAHDDVSCSPAVPAPAVSASARLSTIPSPWPTAPAASALPAAAPFFCAVSSTKILVAEDDALSQAVMRKVLGRLNLRFTMVGDGAAAVEAYRHGAPPCCECAKPTSGNACTVLTLFSLRHA
jgi:hypothetical protein